MDFTGNSLKKLGKRLRDNTHRPEDISLLDSYRESFDELLLDTTQRIGECLRSAKLAFVTAGRNKRTKSLIRKLRRPDNRGMDLSRISDLVGCRVILKSIKEQKMAIEELSKIFELKDIDDYRQAKNYQSVHLIRKYNKRLIEIQVRTLVQHLWAVESESFGERAKEGNGTPDQMHYLKDLAVACKRIEEGESVSEIDFSDTPFMKVRTPLSGSLQKYYPLFESSSHNRPSDSLNSYVIVYNNKTKKLTQKYVFSDNQRGLALEEYKNLNRTLNRDDFECLVLNSNTEKVLKITHPNFF